MNNYVQVYSITDEYMKSNYIKTLEYEVIENIIYFLCTYPIIYMIGYMINKNEIMLYFNFIIIIPILLMTFLRFQIEKMRTFIFSELIVLLISSIITVFILKQYVLVGVLVIYCYKCIKKSLSKQRVDFNKSKLILIEALLIPQSIIAVFVGVNKVQGLILILAILVMFISIGYICKIRNFRLSMDNKQNEGSNKKDSNIFIAGIIILLTIVVFMLYNLGVFDIAFNLTKKFINFIISILNAASGGNEEAMREMFEQNNGDDNQRDIGTQEQETQGEISIIATIILKVILNGTSLIIILSICYVLINRVLIYIKNLGNKDKVTFVFDNIKENEIKKRVNKIKHSLGKNFFINDRIRIRKLYKNKILKYKKDKVNLNNYLSPNEIQDEIFIKTNINVMDITAVYEKARYSNEPITREDIEILKSKKIAKELK